MVDMYLGDWLGRRARLSPDRVALYDAQAGLAPITYRAWDEAAARTAALLRRLGVSRGDRVAVLAFNSVAFLDVWFACGKLGAIMQPLNWRLAAPELAALVADGAPAAFVYGPEFAAAARELRPASPSVRAWVALDESARADTSDTPLAERDGCREPVPPLALGPDAPWVICYTGGTTGTPKGAVLTHGNVAWNAVNTVASWGLCQDDVAILNAPLFHTGGLNVFTAPLVLAGGASVVCRGFDPGQVFDLIAGGAVTLYFGVPTMFAALQQHSRWHEADFSRLKLVISGGAPCPAPIFAAFWERGVDFKTGYGLTEAGPNTFWLPPADVRRKPGAVGHPLLFVDVRVVGEGGAERGPGQVGELQIRGPHVCAGYWGRPEETAKAIGADGWLRTGDLAAYDDEGCYTIVGRSKDVIISGGENIYPAEVESVLCAHPAVAEAALIPAPDARWGEVGWAVVAARPGHALDADDLLAFAAARLARYKLPRRVIAADALPKTAAGKIDKQTLVNAHVQPDRP
jgi:fatty-acyl-CoA synthase